MKKQETFFLLLSSFFLVGLKQEIMKEEDLGQLFVSRGSDEACLGTSTAAYLLASWRYLPL